ncbi:RNA polymerase sigma-70 factor [Xanthovirga aplysinae]|uniref:RNA polymerase sigma-70 factor n=1 Tax=Xanthovirga aplysinae TaxID=2529853 RepID=UPI0012BC0DF0|nr:RNA polymerase sigma-70 factor [Xanthovirga aplysinae]MTI32556.1 RNA polymerase sigma-70 factor [Xanthovirga aplysinae]
MTENEIIAAIQKGNEEVFESIFRNHYEPLCMHAMRYLEDADAAEEVVQELFYQIWQKREELTINSSLKAYLFRSVRNSCLNLIKHEKVKEDYKNYNQHRINVAEKQVSLSVEENELSGLIIQAIEELPEERRKIFKMSRNEGLKYKEIAQHLNISVKTVEAQMGKALRFMREQLAEFLPVWVLLLEVLLNLFKKG